MPTERLYENYTFATCPCVSFDFADLFLINCDVTFFIDFSYFYIKFEKFEMKYFP